MTSFADYTDEFPEFVDCPDDSDWDAPEDQPEAPPMPPPSEQEAREMADHYESYWFDGTYDLGPASEWR